MIGGYRQERLAPQVGCSETNFGFHLTTAQTLCWGAGQDLAAYASKGPWKQGQRIWEHRLSHTFFPGPQAGGQCGSSSLTLPTSCFSNWHFERAHSRHMQGPQCCWVLFKGRVESKPEIPWVQFPVPDHTRPEREAAFRAAASIREPAVQLWLRRTCGNCRLLTLQNVVLNWVDTHSVRLSVQHQTAVQNLKDGQTSCGKYGHLFCGTKQGPTW